MPDQEKPRQRRGFAGMSPEKRTEIARKGGSAVPGDKRSFFKDRGLASAAGRKGGETSHGGGKPKKDRPPRAEPPTPPAPPSPPSGGGWGPR
jgi:hypothetical protein